MKQFMKIFNKVNGKDVLKQYRTAHVLGFALIATIVIGFSKKSLEIVRRAVNNKVLTKLRKKYQAFIIQYKKNYIEKEHCSSHRVWVCWLQGIENAPLLVQKCYKSLNDNLEDREIVLLTEDNYRDFVQFPDFVQKKIDMGIITRTHMSDLLRLELLIKYGGTWVDATVMCSGKNIPKYMLNADLFLFQNLKPGLDGCSTRISSWFMTACTNHPILLLTRELLYEYWKYNTKMVDYFLLHDLFELAIEAYPEEWNKVVPFSNATPHILLLRLFEEYDEKIWAATREQTPFHKLTYKFETKTADKKNTYYEKLFRE